jgi:hypothetical protein
MADEQIHQDLGVDLGHGGPGIHNATEAAVRRREGSSTTEAPSTKTFAQQQQDAAAAKESARVAALTPTQRRLEKLNRYENESGIHSKDPEKQKAAMVELRKLLAADPEEQAALADATLQDHREAFGLEAPDVPDFDEMYGDWEGRFLGHARNDGLGASDVRGIRDLGVKLGTEVSMTGKPISDDVLDRELSKFGLTEGQRAGLKRYWRAIEGGGAA